MHKNLSVLSLTALRFLISSCKHIPGITALHQAMPHFLGEHPFTEWTQHGNEQGLWCRTYFAKALTITETFGILMKRFEWR